MQKTEKMLAENVLAASYTITKTDADIYFNLTGIVHKSMRKLSYSIRIVIDVDIIVFKATECECAVDVELYKRVTLIRLPKPRIRHHASYYFIYLLSLTVLSKMYHLHM